MNEFDGTLTELVTHAQQFVLTGERRILGITGAPGSGKSTVALAIVAALAPAAVFVPMDGFHLANRELERLGRRDRKGAADTFDSAGYAALLRRLRDADEEMVYAPEFRREIEEPIACAVPVSRDATLVVTEGNYLLIDSPPWRPVAGLLDETWYLDVPEDIRLARLVARHVAFGKDPSEALAWSHGSDQRNAELVAATRDDADLIVRLTET